MGLDFLHRDCKIIHTDIKPENIVMSLSETEISEMVKETEYYRKSGKFPNNFTSSIINKNNKNKSSENSLTSGSFDLTMLNDGFKNISLNNDTNRHSCDENYHNYEIEKDLEIYLMRKVYKIIDLGNAMNNKEYFDIPICTLEYRCPETIIGSTLNETADIWAAACMVFFSLSLTIGIRVSNWRLFI
uniref:non-specific serine/threonine protein kinase n=1 Tax=Henneguya salminicola TaxID=69463 RepID=A0A6G3MET7_HENSL